MEMIVNEITGMGYEIWQPTLGGAGVLFHTKKPENMSSGKTFVFQTNIKNFQGLFSSNLELLCFSSDASSMSGVSDKTSDGSSSVH